MEQKRTNYREQLRQVDAIVHFGAGRCSELEQYLGCRPRDIVLVEADPELADALHDRAQANSSVRVVCAAVSGVARSAKFNRYNMRDASSLRAPEGLFKLFPGLRLVEETDVMTVLPKAVLNEVGLDAEKSNMLVVDVPGEELSLISSLKESGHLDIFEEIRLYCGREPLYEGGASAADVLHWLHNNGFELIHEDSSQDMDRPCWVLHRDSLLLENRRLMAKCERLSRIKDQQKVLAAERLKRIRDLQKVIEERTKSIKKSRRQTEAANRERDDCIETIREKNEALRKLSEELESSKREIEELQKQVETITSERNENSYRQTALSEELVKAEGQIELISDILIREKAF